MAYPRFQRARTMKKKRLDTGDVTLSGDVWSAVDTGLDLVLDAVQPGDELVFGLSAQFDSEAVAAYLNVVTVVGGLPYRGFAEADLVKPFAPAGFVGLPGFYAPASTVVGLCLETPPYTVVSGDVSNGQVSLRLVYALATSGTDRTLSASTDRPVDVWAYNLGPLDPE